MSPFGAKLDVSPCLQRAPQSGSCLSPFGTGKPGEAQSVGPGPREGPGKAYVGAGIYVCGSMRGRAWSRRLGLVYIIAIGLHSMTRSDGTYELDMRQGPAKPRPGLDLGQGLGPGFTRVLPHGPRPGPQLGPSPGPGAPFKQPRAWAGLQCYRAGNERIGK